MAAVELRASGNIAVTLRRSRTARRMTLRIGPTGAVVLTLPLRTSLREASKFLAAHDGWLTARLARLPAHVPFADGSVLPFRGVPHRLRHCESGRRPVSAVAGEIVVSGRAEHMERRVADWLRREARSALSARAHVHAAALGRPVPRVGVRDTVSRWGSCSSAGTLSFSWRLILAPDAVLDYVAAHEAAHLVEHNHGPGFWSLVGRLDPDWREARDWLRRHGGGLHRYGPPAFAGRAD